MLGTANFDEAPRVCRLAEAAGSPCPKAGWAFRDAEGCREECICSFTTEEEGGICARSRTLFESGMGEGMTGVAGGKGDNAPSDMGSRAREKVDIEGFGVGITCAWPSSTECLRACGWFTGTVAERARGEDTRGDVGAVAASAEPKSFMITGTYRNTPILLPVRHAEAICPLGRPGNRNGSRGS